MLQAQNDAGKLAAVNQIKEIHKIVPADRKISQIIQLTQAVLKT